MSKKLTKEDLLKRINKIKKDIQNKQTQKHKYKKRLAEEFGCTPATSQNISKTEELTNLFKISFSKKEVDLINKAKGGLDFKQFIKFIIHKYFTDFIKQ